MPKESVVFGLAGVFFGILVGWMIGSQQARTPAATTSAPPAAAQQAQTAPPFDQSRATALEATIAKNASDVESRVQLGDLYFDAERFADATRWYEDALKIDPKHVNASTDLGIAYYYMNQPDRALQQFERSLSDRSEAHQDAVEHRHRAGVRQTGSRGGRESVAASDRPRALVSGSGHGAAGAAGPAVGAPTGRHSAAGTGSARQVS